MNYLYQRFSAFYIDSKLCRFRTWLYVLFPLVFYLCKFDKFNLRPGFWNRQSSETLELTKQARPMFVPLSVLRMYSREETLH